MLAKTDIELADLLGTNRKSLRRWRSHYGNEAPGTRDVETWRLFLRDNLLGPYSARRGYGERVSSDAPEDEDAVFMRKEWEDRREAVFDLLEIVHAGFGARAFGIVEYVRIGDETVELLIRLGKLWDAGIDEDGYRKTWKSIWAKAAEELDERNRAADPDGIS